MILVRYARFRVFRTGIMEGNAWLRAEPPTLRRRAHDVPARYHAKQQLDERRALNGRCRPVVL
jgi:hypothetical protein